MSVNNLEEMSLQSLIELAKKGELIDSAEDEGSRHRIEIGAARFLLDHASARKFIIKLLRRHSSDGPMK